MWVCGSMVYLIPAVAIVAHLLSPGAGAPRADRVASTRTRLNRPMNLNQSG